jgi:hypothetical protein
MDAWESWESLDYDPTRQRATVQEWRVAGEEKRESERGNRRRKLKGRVEEVGDAQTSIRA